MRIWVIGRDYPTQQNNMRGSFELEQAAILAAENEVFYPYVDLHSIRHQRKWGTVVKKENRVKLYRYNLPVGKVPKELFESIERFCWRYILKQMEKEGMPDIIHVHYPAMFWYPLLFPYMSRGVKIVCTEHWSQVMLKKLEPQELESLKWFSENAEFICVGEKLKQSVQELTRTMHPLHVIPDAYPSFFYSPSVERMKKENFQFIAIGRLVREKRFDTLIQAFAQTFAQDTSVTLRIAGDGEEREYLKQIIQRFNMESQIQMLGTKRRHEIAALIRDSDALVCPSRLETFGVPVIEAMACGKPFIATEGLGFRTGLTEECGCIVQGSTESLASAMRHVYENYQQYDAAYISGIAQKYFSEEAVLARLKEVYDGEYNLVSTSSV